MSLTRAIATLFIYSYKRGKALTQALGEPSATATLMKVIQMEGMSGALCGLNMELSRGKYVQLEIVIGRDLTITITITTTAAGKGGYEKKK